MRVLPSQPVEKETSVRDRRPAPASVGSILDCAPAGEPLRGQTRLTGRWVHGAFHDRLPSFSQHIIITYYGAEREIAWHTGKARFASRTRRGSITLIPEGWEGRWDIGGPIEVSHVFLSDQRLQECVEVLAAGKRADLIGRVGFQDPTTARILDLLSRETDMGDTAARLFVEQAIDLLCLQLVRSHASFQMLQPGEAKGGLADWQVKRVTDYMRARLDQDIGLEELASVVQLSRFHFCTAFRKATGCTPHGWLVRHRMEQARQLLTGAELSVTEIALAVGYQTPSAFAAAFRKLVGDTPTEFRKGRRKFQRGAVALQG